MNKKTKKQKEEKAAEEAKPAVTGPLADEPIADEIEFGDLTYTQLCARAGNGWDINIASIIFKNIYNFYYE